MTSRMIRKREMAREMKIIQPMARWPVVEKDCVYSEKREFIMPLEPSLFVDRM